MAVPINNKDRERYIVLSENFTITSEKVLDEKGNDCKGCTNQVCIYSIKDYVLLLEQEEYKKSYQTVELERSQLQKWKDILSMDNKSIQPRDTKSFQHIPELIKIMKKTASAINNIKNKKFPLSCNEECCICLNTIKKNSTVTSFHKLHACHWCCNDCFKKMELSENKCPICRETF